MTDQGVPPLAQEKGTAPGQGRRGGGQKTLRLDSLDSLPAAEGMARPEAKN